MAPTPSSARRELLDVLRNAGVVDAGGAGLLEIVRGIAAALAGEPIPEAPPEEELTRRRHPSGALASSATAPSSSSRARDSTAKCSQAKLEPLGDSLLVVGDATAVKVHVHTDDPGAALSLGTAVGTLEQVEIANMHKQTERREERLLHVGRRRAAARARSSPSSPGAGNRELFESSGATQIVEGGQSMNPSAADLVAAIDRTSAPSVFVLPNNSNVILAAEQAADARGRRTCASSAPIRFPRASPRSLRSTVAQMPKRMPTAWRKRSRPSRRAP